MTPLRIGIVTPRYFPFVGGVEHVVRNVAEQLVGLGMCVTVHTRQLSNALPKNEVVNRVMVKRHSCVIHQSNQRYDGSSQGFLLKEQPSMGLVASLLRDPPNVVHVNDIHDLTSLASIASATCAKKSKVIVTPHYHGSGHSSAASVFWRGGHVSVGAFLRRADMIQAVSETERDFMRRDFAIPKQKICVIPNGVDEDLLDYRWRPQKNRLRLIYAGRLVPYKRVSLVIRSIALVPAKYAVELVIVGAGVDELNLRNLVKEMGLQDRVRFLGFVPRDRYFREVSESSALVNLSEKEAFGLTVYEALCMGVPVIVSRSGALVEFASHAAFALSATPSPEDVASAITTLAEGKFACRGNFAPVTWREVAERLLSVYRSALA
ncbi:MAG: glycosyltransferase family 4 protein [Candidatus Bathyarchaeia archaeon]